MSKISLAPLRPQLTLIYTGLNREQEGSCSRKRERNSETERQRERDGNLSWYSNRVWLNFNNFSTFCSLTFFCLLGPRHALITTYNVWVASLRCTTQQDPLSAPLPPPLPLPLPLPPARCCRVWLPLVTLMAASTDSTRVGHDLCGPKSENCAQTCCKWTTKKEAKLKRCATTCCIHCANTLLHITFNLHCA